MHPNRHKPLFCRTDAGAPDALATAVINDVPSSFSPSGFAGHAASGANSLSLPLSLQRPTPHAASPSAKVAAHVV